LNAIFDFPPSQYLPGRKLSISAQRYLAVYRHELQVMPSQSSVNVAGIRVFGPPNAKSTTPSAIPKYPEAAR